MLWRQNFCHAIVLLLWNIAGGEDGLHPLFFWVDPEVKKALLEAAVSEDVPLAKLFERWVDLSWTARGLLAAHDTESLPQDARAENAKDVDSNLILADKAFDSLPADRQDRFVLKGLDWAALQKLGGASRRVVLTWTTGDKQEFVALAQNLALSVQRHAPGLVAHFCTIALDLEAEEALLRRGLCALRYNAPATFAVAAAERWDFKKRLLATALVLGLEALVLDADSVLLGDPFTTAIWKDSDLETGTDHFFPDRDLWQPHMRPEEHLNTGFLYGNGQGASGGRLFCFLASFLELFSDTDWMALGRDFFDQRAFNKFVLMHLAQEPSMARIRYENQIMPLPHGWPSNRLAIAAMLQGRSKIGGLCSGMADQPVTIRVLNPEEVSHGMNFFWRASHLSRPDRRPPAFVHANGVDDKLYFMRDRGIWFVDDWKHRFSPNERFLRYLHPRGQDLTGDFTTLLAALELAKALKRRLVLPRTMRCANSPAHSAYGLQIEDCTVDHFASAKILFHYHNESLVEASLVDNPEFQALQASSKWVAPQHRQPAAFLDDSQAAAAAVLLLEVDVKAARDAAADLGLAAELRCKFAYWPGRQMACRDEGFLRAFGNDQACHPQPGQEACGVKGFACCEVFHGWAEKLEFFTGRPWSLPCNCGLNSTCAQFERTSDYPQLTENHRCCHRRNEDPPTLQCFDIGSFPASNPMMDFNSYSSDVLWAFDAGLLQPADVFQACQRWTEAASVSMSLSTKSHDVGRDCTWLVSTFLLTRENHEALVKWLDYMVRHRRPLWMPGVITVTMTSGVGDGGSFSLWKLHHDMQQLDFLLRHAEQRGLTTLGSSNATMAWVRDSLLPNYAELFEATRAGRAKEDLFTLFGNLDGVFNRILFLDHRSDGAAREQVLSESAAAALVAGRQRADVLVVDNALVSAALEELRWALLSSTIWFGARQGQEGVLLWASLLDGLHSPTLLRLAQELRQLLPDLFGKYPLRDVIARKYHSTRPNVGTGPHALDAEMVACVWLLPSAATNLPAGGGIRVSRDEAPDYWSEDEAFDWAREDRPRGFMTDAFEVERRSNRLALWPGRRLLESVPTEDWPDDYEEKRVEVFLLFGSQRRWTLGI